MGLFDNPEGLFPVTPGTPVLEGVDIVDPKINDGDPIPPLGCDIGTDCEKALVIFVGGALDTKYRPLYREFAVYCREGHPHQAKAYFTHDADREIAKYITLWRKRYPGHQVGIVGHSWGGYCSYQVAQRLAGDGIPLDLLVTLDPVTKRDFERRDGFEITKSNRPFERPRTTERWYNVFVRDDPAMPTCSNVSMGTSNRVARNGGGSWRDLKLRGLVHGEWEITSDIVSNNSPVCHMDNGHELVQKMLTNVHKYIRDLA